MMTTEPSRVLPHLRSDEIWYQVLAADMHAFSGRPALFLDRDGVIVEEVNYLHRKEDIVFIPGVETAIRQANELGLAVIMVTNQAGIGRGYYGWQEFAEVNQCIVQALAASEARVDAVVACPFHEKGVTPWRQDNHPMRKPNPGMFLLAGEDFAVDFGRSLVVGDKMSDLMAGHAAGIGEGFLVLTGHGQDEQAILDEDNTMQHIRIVPSIADTQVAVAIVRMAGAARNAKPVQ